MSDELTQLAERLAGRAVLVLGEAILDTYLEGAATRLCPEAPAPVVSLAERRDLPGGAANTAANARALGGRVSFLAAAGTDREGDTLREALSGAGVPTEHVLACPGRRTLAKTRVLAGGQTLLRIDQGSTGDLDPAAEAALLARLAELFPAADAVVVSDYRYGVVTPRVLRALAELRARHPRVLVADSPRLHLFGDLGLTAAKLNYPEAAALLGVMALPDGAARADGLAGHADRLLELTGTCCVAVTLDSDGALLLERGRAPHRIAGPGVRPTCAAGAGDTFTAALALALAAGAEARQAAALASAAAAVAVAKEGTAVCTAAELRGQLAAGGKFVADLGQLAQRVAAHKREGRRVVLTNGCFDLLHRGHVTLLGQARALGDVLVVALNTDDGVRRLKGPGRPVNPLEDRAGVLAALACVDHLTAFGEDTPCEVIRALKPDVFVKGGDYTRERLPEVPLVEELGGVVRILTYLEERSTTGIIRKIQQT
jgi:D-beta-D-heptose 7-phosphate kinase/D-beta-D-heptose 1-phosphate adenosyltransferase